MAANDGLHDLRILVVDDDKDTREMLRFILEEAGGHTVAVGSVTEALESYKSSPPDVIVSDVGMPDYNGYALIALVRAHDTEFGRTTPLLRLPRSRVLRRKRLRWQQALETYMSKPFDPRERSSKRFAGSPPLKRETNVKTPVGTTWPRPFARITTIMRR